MINKKPNKLPEIGPFIGESIMLQLFTETYKMMDSYGRKLLLKRRYEIFDYMMKEIHESSLYLTYIIKDGKFESFPMFYNVPKQREMTSREVYNVIKKMVTVNGKRPVIAYNGTVENKMVKIELSNFIRTYMYDDNIVVRENIDFYMKMLNRLIQYNDTTSVDMDSLTSSLLFLTSTNQIVIVCLLLIDTYMMIQQSVRKNEDFNVTDFCSISTLISNMCISCGYFVSKYILEPLSNDKNVIFILRMNTILEDKDCISLSFVRFENVAVG